MSSALASLILGGFALGGAEGEVPPPPPPPPIGVVEDAR